MHLLAHFSDGFTGQSWAGLTPGARGFLCVFRVGVGGLSVAVTSCCLPSSADKEQPGLEQEPTWDAGLVGGSFTCFASVFVLDLVRDMHIKVLIN